MSSGLESVIVGYRRDDRAKLNELEVEYGLRALRGGRCIACNVEVMFVLSGQDAIRTRDPHLICDRCRNTPDVWADVMAEL